MSIDAGRGPARLAIVGCGAVTRECHGPALASADAFALVALVDRVPANAAAVAASLRTGREDPGAPIHVTSDLGEILPLIDAAIVATDAGSHADVAAELLRAGKHVLVEKPLAVTIAEGERIRDAAGDSGAVAVVAHVRRMFRSAPFVREVLSTGRLGAIARISWSQGNAFGWPLASAAAVDPSRPGAGVLADLAPHALDILRHWLGSDAVVTAYGHNGEATAASEAELRLAIAGVPVDLRLSWLRALANRCVIEGELGTLSIGLHRNGDFEERDGAGRTIDRGAIGEEEGRPAPFARQLDAFARATEGLETELATLDDGLATICLVASCDGLRDGRLARPWRGPARGRGPAPMPRIAVTGATGFLGASVVERLPAGSAGRHVAISRSFAGLVRLSHLDGARLRCVRADVRDGRALRDAFSGCAAVIHAAYGSSGSPAERWSVTVDGTAAALDAALATGVSRFVHIGSMAVYDLRAVASLDESCQLLDVGDGDRSYAQQKLAAEQLVLRVGAAAMEVVSLQPAIVYGPCGPNWTVRPLERLRRGEDDLPSGDAGGTCNPVHVHDVADAAVFLATAPACDERRLLVTGPGHVTWGAYYDGYRELAGATGATSFDAAQAPPLYRERAVVDAGRLRNLGFEPRIGLAQGMAHVAEWARWAGLAGTSREGVRA